MNLKKYHIYGAIIVIIVGSLLHFVYEWSGNNRYVGYLGAVSESTWEHLKLLFVPAIAFGIFEYFSYGKQFINFMPVKFLSILVGMLTIVALFYTYTGIMGKNFLVLDIGTFILGAIAMYAFSYHYLQTDKFSSPLSVVVGSVGLISLAVLFVIFTYSPPKIGLFKVGSHLK